MIDETVTSLPPALAQPILGLEALAGLLGCIDPPRWASLARPPSEGLAAILHLLTAELAAALAEHHSP